MKDEEPCIDYFPIMRAISLKGECYEKEQMDELMSLVQSVHDRFGSLEEFVKSYQKYGGLPSATLPPPP